MDVGRRQRGCAGSFNSRWFTTRQSSFEDLLDVLGTVGLPLDVSVLRVGAHFPVTNRAVRGRSHTAGCSVSVLEGCVFAHVRYYQ